MFSIAQRRYRLGAFARMADGMRRQDHIRQLAQRAVRRQRLLVVDVERDLVEPALLGDRDDRGLIDETAARRIDQHRVRLHQPQLVERSACRGVSALSVASTQTMSLVRNSSSSSTRRTARRQRLVQARRIGLQRRPPNWSRRCGDRPRHVAEADHADRLAAQHPRLHAAAAAARSRLQCLDLLGKIMQAGEDQHDRRLGDAEVILGHLAIGDGDAERRRAGEIETFHSDPGIDHRAQMRRRFQAARGCRDSRCHRGYRPGRARPAWRGTPHRHRCTDHLVPAMPHSVFDGGESVFGGGGPTTMICMISQTGLYRHCERSEAIQGKRLPGLLRPTTRSRALRA